MSEDEFWRCTPSKIFELIDVKMKLKNSDKSSKSKSNKEKEWDTVMYAVD